MRRFLKFVHTIGAIGLMGSMASLLAMIATMPDPATQLGEYAAVRDAMGAVSLYVFLPSVALTLIGGMLSMAITPAFHSAGWVLAKLASGILMFEWSLIAVDGPIRKEAKEAAAALLSEQTNQLGDDVDRLWWSMLILCGVAVVNVVLGVWRPKFINRKKPAASADDQPAAQS